MRIEVLHWIKSIIYIPACHIIPENTTCSPSLWQLVVHALLHLIYYKMYQYIFVRRAGECLFLNRFIGNTIYSQIIHREFIMRYMITAWHWNFLHYWPFVRITYPGVFPSQRASSEGLWCFPWWKHSMRYWINSPGTGDLRRQDVNMWSI